MKKVLLMIVAALLLMTQCRKDEMPAVMPETNTVRMTVTVGSGSKTDISETGGIAWSSGDRLYVGNGSKCIGCLDIEQSDTGQATANFSGKVDLTGVADGQEFGFFYLGNCNSIDWNPQNTVEGFQYTVETEPWSNATSATVVFSGQSGKLDELEKFHIGYGDGNLKEVVNETGKVTISGIVSMESKVALVQFNFTKDNDDPVTVSGIYDKMTVNFNGSFVGSYKDGKTGTFTLNNNEAYVMLVPTTTVTELKLFYHNKTRLVTFNEGIEENKFYKVSVDFKK
ncbi:MAG: hypothetical protein MJ000_01540 [Bacteroidales bacterium]|nr:hypothetical protein [Bacteroidales bacterium]